MVHFITKSGTASFTFFSKYPKDSVLFNVNGCIAVLNKNDLVLNTVLSESLSFDVIVWLGATSA
jgi:hypothetical protein